MAETYNAFKGFKIVHSSTWENLKTTPEKKKGYLWFVRTGDVDDKSNVTKGDIYFGTRHYGQYDPTNASDIAELKKVLGTISNLPGKVNGIPETATTVEEILKFVSKPYTEGDGITISETETSKVIASNTNATTVSDITIAGGPINATGIFPGNKIEAGTSVQEILTKLLCKEIFPKAATKPTITVSASGAPSGLREINSTVTIPAFTTSTNAGHFNSGDNDTHKQPDTGSKFSNIKFTTTVSSGFTNYNVATNAPTVEQQTGITVSEGANSIKCNVSGNYTAPDTTPTTNLGNPAPDATYTFEAGTATNSTTVSVTGVYPIYSNGTPASNDAKTANAQVSSEGPTMIPQKNNKHSLINTGGKLWIFFAKQAAAPYTIYLPTGKYKITEAKMLNPTANAYDANVLNNFIANESTVTLQSGGKDMTYTAYEYSGANGPNCVEFTIGKA